MRGLLGSFAFMPLQDVVELLARRKASGSLTCERGTIRKTAWFQEGIAVGSSSNDPREHLGQLLLNFGHLTEEQLGKAFETQQETRIHLGKVLSMVGAVPPGIIRDTLALQVREILLDAFVWDAGVFRVDDERPPAVDDLDPRVPLQDIAREAEFRTTAWSAFRAQFPTGTATLLVKDGTGAAPPPASVDERILALARDGKTIDEIGLALHATDFQLYQRLYALNRQGILETAAAGYGAPAAVGSDDQVADDEATARLRSALLDPLRKPRLKVPGHQIALMRLSAPEKYLLGRCDGVRNLRQIVQLAPLSEGDVLRAMERFVEARIVEMA